MAAPSFIAGNIGPDTSQAGFTMGSPTGGTPAQGDWWWCVLNARNNEQLSAALSGWNYVGASPVASDTSSTGISQIFVYYTIQGGSAPSLAVTRGSGPNLCNWGLHVYRPASGYVWDEVNLDYSFQTEASAVTAHSHPSVNANAVDAIISHFIGFAGNGGGSALDATDPSTGSGAGSTANTTDFTSGLWNRRGNQGSSSLMTGGMTLGTGLKVNAGATGACISTQTLSRRHASFVAALSQVKVATLTDAATSGEAGFTGYRIKQATLTEASVSAETLAAMRIRLAAMTEAAAGAETLAGTLIPGGSPIKQGVVTDAATSAETFTAQRIRQAAVTDAATSAEPFNAAKRIRQAAVTDLAQSAEPFNAAKRIRKAAVDDPAQSGEDMVRRAIKRAALTDAAQSGQSFSVRGWSIVTPTGEVWTPILSTAEVWTVIPSTAETWS